MATQVTEAGKQIDAVMKAEDGQRPDAGVSSSTRAELWWKAGQVAVVLGLAAAIRSWNFGSIGYQHWDDYYFISGADAVSRVWPKGLSSISWATAPLVPYTAATLFHFFGTNTWMPIAASVVYGTLAVPALYLLCSRMFGHTTGLIAAAILATAEFPVMFSRMAIADAAFEFWLIVSVLFLWLAVTTVRMRYWLVAGVATGALLNTKYNGSFPLVLGASWLTAEFVIDVVAGNRASFSSGWSAYVRGVLGLGLMAVVAFVLFAPWLYELNHNPGFPTFFARYHSFSMQHTPPLFVLWYYWRFASPATVVLAAAGVVAGLRRFARADRLLLIYTAGWLVAVLAFDAYPREALTLMPAVAIWAARGVLEVWKLVRAWGPRFKYAAAAAGVVCAVAVVVAQSLALPQLLNLRVEGYADAGVVAARYQAAGDTLLVRAQDSAFLYLNDQAIVLGPDPAVVKILKDNPASAVLMTDLTVDAFQDAKSFFDLNRDRVQVIARVPNPLYPELYLQPATSQKLAQVDNPPDQYRYITFWRVTGPVVFPRGWPQ